MATGAIIARIISQYSDKGSKSAKKDIAKLGRDFDKFAKKATIAFAAASIAVGAFAVKVGKDAVTAAMDDQKSQVLLANSLRNTVKASDATIASTENFVTLLQKQVSVADDELRPALARLTAATGSVEGGQQLLATALNISASSGADLASSSDAVIKATKGQYKAIALLVPGLSAATLKSKDFNKILGQTNKETMGAAAKRAGTLEFRLKGLQLAYGEILETLGYALIPVIQNFADIIQNRVLPQLEAWIAANKDKLAAALTTILNTIPLIITQLFGFFDAVQSNIGTLKILAALITGLFVGGKVLAGIAFMVKAIQGLAIAYNVMTGSATAAGIAAALASGGATAVAGAAAIVAFGAAATVVYSKLNNSNTQLTETTKKADMYWGNVYDSAKATIKPVKTVYDFTSKGLKLTKDQLKAQANQILSEKELAKLKAMGVVPTTEIDPIQLEAVRLNLIKEQNLAQKAMYDQLLASYEAHNRINIAAQRYADILMVIADNKISEVEVALLASKWNLTNLEVLKYMASVTGNVNLGSGWDAAGLAAGDGWKKALADVNAYLEAVGKANFVSKTNVPAAPPTSNGVYGIGGAGGLVRQREYDIPGLASLPKMPPMDIPFVSPSVSMPDYQSYRSGERGDINVTVNNAGSVTTDSDLTETIRNGILAGQTSGKAITTSVLDL